MEAKKKQKKNDLSGPVNNLLTKKGNLSTILEIYPLYSFDLSIVLSEFFLNIHTFTKPWILQP